MTRTTLLRFIASLFALSLVINNVAHAQTALTLGEAQRVAVERSHQVAAQDAAITASREMAVAARQLPDPVATMGINNLPIDGPDRFSLTRDFMTMRSVGVMQEFTREAKRNARGERLEREADKSRAEQDLVIVTVRRDTALAWLDRYYAEAMAAVVAEQSSQARLEIDAAETAYRGGRGNLADILAARSALTLLDDRASELGRRVATARIWLSRWVGPIAEEILVGKPAIDTIHLDPAKLDTDLQHHPDLVVLAKKEDLVAAEVRVAEANRNVDWTVALMYSQRGPAFSNMVSVNVSVPLQWDRRNRQDREVAAKLAMREQIRAEREDMTRAHIAEVRAMIAEWQNDRERMTRYERELLPMAAERTEATLDAFRGAKMSLGDVLLARRNEIDLRLQALQLEADTARLWAQIEFLLPEHGMPNMNATRIENAQ